MATLIANLSGATSDIVANVSNLMEEDDMDSKTDGHSVPPLKMALDIILICIILAIMLAMGSTITLTEVWKHLRMPIGILVGMLSQFIILPLCGFILAKAMTLKPSEAIGMLVLSCCPGGTMSNLFTYWTDGDVPLSITMTTCSTVLAFGMMPLNLFIYSSIWTSESIKIPYIKIVITLASILGPVAIGIAVKWKFPKVAFVLSKVGSAVGMLGILTTLIMQSILFPGMYMVKWNVWLSAALFPLIGLTAGFGLASIARREMTVRKAIAFETGSQNVALAMTVLFLTFPYEILAEATSFPQLYAVLMLTMYGLFSATYNLRLRLCTESRRVGANATCDNKHDDVAKKEIDSTEGQQTTVQANGL